MYQQRLLLFVDILGWTPAVHKSLVDPHILRDVALAVERIHLEAEVRNQRFRDDLLAQDGQGIAVFKMALEVQFGAFSDHFVFSMPESFGPRILSTAQKLVRDLLQIGWLTRGAIVQGPLHHKDNMIFGPALLEAVEIEQREANFPRILISDDALRNFEGWSELEGLDDSLITDQHGSVVVNPFSLPGVFTGLRAEEMLGQFVEVNFGFRKIRQMIAKNLEKYGDSPECARIAAKWQYMHNFIAGPLFSEHPELQKFW